MKAIEHYTWFTGMLTSLVYQLEKAVLLTGTFSSITCTQLGIPMLTKYTELLEKVQHRETKLITGDYEVTHKNRLIPLNMLPLMYSIDLPLSKQIFTRRLLTTISSSSWTTLTQTSHTPTFHYLDPCSQCHLSNPTLVAF